MRSSGPAPLNRPWRVNQRHGVSYEGLIAVGCAYPNTFAASGTMQCFTDHVAVDDIVAYRLLLANFYSLNETSPASGVEVATGAATVVTASVEFPIGGSRAQTLFAGGKTSGSIPNGLTLLTPWNRPPSLIPRGSTFRIHRYETNSATKVVFCTWNTSANDGLSGVTAVDVTMGGTPPVHVAGFSAPPLGIIGMTRRPSVGLLGDSIMAGYLSGDYSMAGYRRGNIAPGLPNDATMAVVNIGLPNEQCSDLVSSGARKALFPYFSHVICGYGFNDLNVGAKTNAQLKASLLQLYQQLPQRCLITQCTILPYTTSAGNIWRTDVDQTVVDAGTKFLEKVAFNADVRAGSVPGVNNGYYDPAAYANSGGGPPADNGKWVGNAAVDKYYTSDGVHPKQQFMTDFVATYVADAGARLHYP